jgi:hypothetical protein
MLMRRPCAAGRQVDGILAVTECDKFGFDDLPLKAATGMIAA